MSEVWYTLDVIGYVCVINARVASGRIGGPGVNNKMALTNVVESAKSTIAREARRANQKYAEKAIAASINLRNNAYSNAFWSSSFKFAAGAYVSNILNLALT